MANFKAKTDEEIQTEALIPEGEYDFEITDADEYTNDKGNDVFKLNLNVFDHKGNPRAMLDWITPSFAKKFKHFCYAVGLNTQYDAGSVTQDDMLNKKGKLILTHKTYTNKYGDEVLGHSVDDYVKKPSKPGKADLDDEIPF